MLFSFKLKDLQPLLAHARQAEYRTPFHGGAGEVGVPPALFLIRDDGVCLKSNGLPPLQDPGRSESERAVHARGWGPGSHPAGGGFVESIAVESIDSVSEGCSSIEIELTDSDITVRGVP